MALVHINIGNLILTLTQAFMPLCTVTRGHVNLRIFVSHIRVGGFTY